MGWVREFLSNLIKSTGEFKIGEWEALLIIADKKNGDS